MGDSFELLWRCRDDRRISCTLRIRAIEAPRLLVPGFPFACTGWGRAAGEEVGRSNPWRVAIEHADLARLVLEMGQQRIVSAASSLRLSEYAILNA